MLKNLSRLFLLFIAAVIIFILILTFLVTQLDTFPKRQNFYVLKIMAVSGDTKAMLRLGDKYYYGYGDIDIDYKEAFKWYQMAAHQGDKEGLSKIGVMYSVGQGVEESKEKAFNSFLLGANKGNLVSMYNLGQMYYKGIGVEKNEQKAFEWWIKAAKEGDSDAQFWVGFFYDNGKASLNKDFKEAAFWYKKAADQNNDNAQTYLALMYRDGDGVDIDLLRAGELLFMASRHGNIKAKEVLDEHRNNCAHRIENYGIFYKYEDCYLTAYSEYPEGMHAVGLSFYEGKFQKEVDYREAFKWLLKSAQAGHSNSQYLISNLYAYGKGTNKNYIESYAWLKASLNGQNLNISYQKKASQDLKFLLEQMNSNEVQDAENKSFEYIK